MNTLRLAAAMAAGLGLALAAAPTLTAEAAPAAKAAAQPSSKPNVAPEALQALQKMSAYLTSLSGFELTSDTTLDLVTVQGQRLQFGGVAKYKVKKPNAFTISVESDLKDRDFVYDGKTFTVYAPQLGYYTTVPAPGTIRETLAAIDRKFGVTLPLEDLFRWADADQLRQERLDSGFDVGAATIDGVDTEQYAFREGHIDWQVWIKDGPEPLPLKVVIVDRSDPANPAYVARLTWKVNPTLTAGDFVFRPQANAKSIRLMAAGK
jgi:hypothetical protein